MTNLVLRLIFAPCFRILFLRLFYPLRKKITLDILLRIREETIAVVHCRGYRITRSRVQYNFSVFLRNFISCYAFSMVVRLCEIECGELSDPRPLCTENQCRRLSTPGESAMFQDERFIVFDSCFRPRGKTLQIRAFSDPAALHSGNFPECFQRTLPQRKQFREARTRWLRKTRYGRMPQ